MTQICNTFLGMQGAEAMKLGDITANSFDDSDEGTYDVWDWTGFTPFTDFIQPMDSTGKFTGKFTYVPQGYIDKKGLTAEPGWYDYYDPNCEGKCYNNEKIPFSRGFYLCAGDGAGGLAPALIFNGEVKKGNSELPVASSMMMTGNASPVDITLGQITANSFDDSDEGTYDVWDWTGFTPFTDFIQPMSKDGKFKGMFTYVPQEYIDKKGLTAEPGWYDYYDPNCEGECYNNLKIEAGEAFYLCAGDGAGGLAPTITIPGALPAAD